MTYTKWNTRVKHGVYITYPVKHLSCNHGVVQASLNFSLKRRKHWNSHGYQNTITEHFETKAMFSTVSRKLKLVGVVQTFRSLVNIGEGKTSNNRLYSVRQSSTWKEFTSYESNAFGTEFKLIIESPTFVESFSNTRPFNLIRDIEQFSFLKTEQNCFNSGIFFLGGGGGGGEYQTKLHTMKVCEYLKL